MEAVCFDVCACGHARSTCCGKHSNIWVGHRPHISKPKSCTRWFDCTRTIWGTVFDHVLYFIILTLQYSTLRQMDVPTTSKLITTPQIELISALKLVVGEFYQVVTALAYAANHGDTLHGDFLCCVASAFKPSILVLRWNGAGWYFKIHCSHSLFKKNMRKFPST